MKSFDNDKAPIIKKTSLSKKLFYDYFQILVLLVLVLVFASGYFAFVNPKIIEVKNNISDKKAEKEKEIKSLQDYFDKLQQYKIDYEKISKEDKDRINIMLPKGYNYEDMYREINATAKSIGIEIKALNITEDNAKSKATPTRKKQVVKTQTKTENGLPDNVGKVSVDMEISGLNYSGLKNVLAAYEKDLRIVDINTIFWQPNGESVQFNFDTYFLKD